MFKVWFEETKGSPWVLCHVTFRTLDEADRWMRAHGIKRYDIRRVGRPRPCHSPTIRG